MRTSSVISWLIAHAEGVRWDHTACRVDVVPNVSHRYNCVDGGVSTTCHAGDLRATRGVASVDAARVRADVPERDDVR